VRPAISASVSGLTSLPASRQLATPSRHCTCSIGHSQINPARRFRSATTFSAAWTTAMPVANVTRLPPVVAEKPIEVVSATMARTRSIGRPRVSAAIIAMAAREPPMSGLLDTTVAPPSSSTWTAAEDSPPMLNQNPQATPRPWLGPSGAE
jgi:hypothetical protein